jgi:hypothetical protein
MLGHLRMNVDEAIDALVSVATAVFPYEVPEKCDSETNMKHLKEAVENMLQARQIPHDTKMNDKDGPSVKCKVYVSTSRVRMQLIYFRALYAATKANLSHPTIFRTYPSRGSGFNPTIVEAICSTIASPSLFPPVKIGSRPREQNFAGGPLGANNPTRELLKEANTAFGKDRKVAQILSVGCGRPKVLSSNESVATGGISLLLQDLAWDCEMVAQELSARLFNIDAYLRLNVDRGMESIRMDEWNELGNIEIHTNAYMQTNATSEALEASLRRMKERIGTVTLGQISAYACTETMIHF